MGRGEKVKRRMKEETDRVLEDSEKDVLKMNNTQSLETAND
jgi:hypothetical protein